MAPNDLSKLTFVQKNALTLTLLDRVASLFGMPPPCVRHSSSINAAEPVLRPSVVFRKLTSGFRSIWGVDVHALIRSIIGAGRING